MSEKITTERGVVREQVINHLRSELKVAVETFGGIQWTVGGLYKVFDAYEKNLRKYVSIEFPSPFKRCSAFAMAFMEEYPIFGQFKKHKFLKDLILIDRFSGAVLAFEYIRYSLDQAVIHWHSGETRVLKRPILVSEHSYIDLVHAISHLKDDDGANFHLTALLFENLAYRANPKASYHQDC